MKKLLAPVAALALSLTGCSTTNLSKVLHELKTDPATVKFSVMAPGWAVIFERSWPTNVVVPTNMTGSVTLTPVTTLRVDSK